MVRAILGTTLMVFTCHAQPAFEVASIKPAPPPDGKRMLVGMNGGPGTHDPGLFNCLNCSLSDLLTQAYNVKRFQVSGPSWMESERFNITARVPEGSTKEQFRLMMQNLLAERFKLTLHHDSKEMPMYELLVGKGGPKLKESVEDPAPQDGPPNPAALPPLGPPKFTMDKDGYPVLPAGRGGTIMMNGRGRMQATKQSMEQFANTLSNQVGRPVTDATGLKGKYDFTLSWALERMGGREGFMPPPPPEGGAPVASTPDGDAGPTLFGAIQAQLGLKLESKKGPVGILAIDHIEKVPTEN